MKRVVVSALATLGLCLALAGFVAVPRASAQY